MGHWNKIKNKINKKYQITFYCKKIPPGGFFILFVSLRQGLTGQHYIDQGGFELRDPPVPASKVFQ